MDLDNFRADLRDLAQTRETDAPVLSCYVDVRAGEAGYRKALDERVRILRATLPHAEREHFEVALGQIEAYLASRMDPSSAGIALFTRAGAEPFLRTLQFRVPIFTSLSVDRIPNLHRLVGLEDMEEESFEGVGILVDELRRGGLAVAGTRAVIKALRRGNADELIMAAEFRAWGWHCGACGALGQVDDLPAACIECGTKAIRRADLRAEIARLAVQHDVNVEILRNSDALLELDGVGCLLRYLGPEGSVRQRAIDMKRKAA